MPDFLPRRTIAKSTLFLRGLGRTNYEGVWG
jgi:hypothetical protein